MSSRLAILSATTRELKPLKTEVIHIADNFSRRNEKLTHKGPFKLLDLLTETDDNGTYRFAHFDFQAQSPAICSSKDVKYSFYFSSNTNGQGDIKNGFRILRLFTPDIAVALPLVHEISRNEYGLAHRAEPTVGQLQTLIEWLPQMIVHLRPPDQTLNLNSTTSPGRIT